MGLIFDQNIERIYDAWFHSPQGRAIDRSLEKLLGVLLDPRPGERVLDIGCGSGNHLLVLSRLCLNVSGIDASPHMINRARARMGRACSLKTGMAEDLPFDDNEFDLAVLINTLEFLDDPLSALREAGRVAKRRVFLGVINSLSWNGLLKRIQGYVGNPLFGPARFYNLWQLKGFLRSTFGRAPTSWGCVQFRPSFVQKITPFPKTIYMWRHSPFATFLGLSTDIVYQMKTDNLPLRVKLKKASRSLVGARTLEDLNRSRRVSASDERGPTLRKAGQ